MESNLRCAKQAYLALTPAQRAEFDHFVASTKVASSESLKIKLMRGDGKRARHKWTAGDHHFRHEAQRLG